MDCLFCKIVEGQIPAQIAYEDEQVIAFHDLHPQAPTHILVIPKRHIATLNELTPDTADSLLMGQLVYTATQLAKKLNLADDGYRLVTNCNTLAGQTIFHLHLHLLGGRSMQWPPG